MAFRIEKPFYGSGGESKPYNGPTEAESLETLIAGMWDLNAEAYYVHKAEKANPTTLIDIPEILKHLPGLSGLTVVDVGSGAGYLFSLLDRLGLLDQAKQLIAFDISHEMIQLAKHELNQELGYSPKILLLQASATGIPLQNNSVDVALSVNAMDSFPDLNKAFREIHRILGPESTFILLVKHPRRNAGKALGKRDSKVKDTAIDEGPYLESFPGLVEPVLKYYWHLSTWRKAAAAAGFSIQSEVAPMPNQSLQKSHPELYERYALIGSSLLLVLKKAR